jgi:sugar O-acyltransferase (sialic acid O-acetyltransferase NeuD family)
MGYELRKPVIILGAGGHAKVLIDALQQLKSPILGITDPRSEIQMLMGIPVLGDDDKILDYSPQDVLLVNTLGSIKNTGARRKLYDTWKTKGYHFATVVHPKAILAPDVQLAEGVQVLAGAIINTGTQIGKNSIINTGSILEHDCNIGSHIHIAPGVRIAGQVHIGDNSHIGIGSTIIQNLTIGENCLIAAGAVVVTSCQDNLLMMGVPAKAYGDS